MQFDPAYSSLQPPGFDTYSTLLMIKRNISHQARHDQPPGMTRPCQQTMNDGSPVMRCMGTAAKTIPRCLSAFIKFGNPPPSSMLVMNHQTPRDPKLIGYSPVDQSLPKSRLVVLNPLVDRRINRINSTTCSLPPSASYQAAVRPVSTFQFSARPDSSQTRHSDARMPRPSRSYSWVWRK